MRHGTPDGIRCAMAAIGQKWAFANAGRQQCLLLALGAGVLTAPLVAIAQQQSPICFAPSG